MAAFLIYCPCKVKELGLARIDSQTTTGILKDVFPYLLWEAIRFPGSVKIKGTCRHCGEILQIHGTDPQKDKKAGITKKMTRKAWTNSGTIPQDAD